MKQMTVYRMLYLRTFILLNNPCLRMDCINENCPYAQYAQNLLIVFLINPMERKMHLPLSLGKTEQIRYESIQNREKLHQIWLFHRLISSLIKKKLWRKPQGNTFCFLLTLTTVHADQSWFWKLFSLTGIFEYLLICLFIPFFKKMFECV